MRRWHSYKPGMTYTGQGRGVYVVLLLLYLVTTTVDAWFVCWLCQYEVLQGTTTPRGRRLHTIPHSWFGWLFQFQDRKLAQLYSQWVYTDTIIYHITVPVRRNNASIFLTRHRRRHTVCILHSTANIMPYYFTGSWNITDVVAWYRADTTVNCGCTSRFLLQRYDKAGEAGASFSSVRVSPRCSLQPWYLQYWIRVCKYYRVFSWNQRLYCCTVTLLYDI